MKNGQIDVTNVMNALSIFQIDFLETLDNRLQKEHLLRLFLSLEQAHWTKIMVPVLVWYGVDWYDASDIKKEGAAIEK